jgi:hypothetical protein
MRAFDYLYEWLHRATLQAQLLQLNTEYNNQRELVIIYRAREEQLLRILQEEKEERHRLQEIIFRNFGIRITDETPSPEQDENIKPISVGTQRWSGLKNRLEQDDRKRAANEKT